MNCSKQMAFVTILLLSRLVFGQARVNVGIKEIVIKDFTTIVQDVAEQPSLVITADTLHTAYIKKVGAEFVVVRDGINGKRYPKIDLHSLVFSSDGKRLAYFASENGKWFVVFDGKEGKRFSETTNGPILSPGGQHVAYCARVDGRLRAVVDDREFLDGIDVYFNRDGTHFAYSGFKNDNRFFGLDGIEQPSNGFWDGLAFDQKNRISYRGQIDGKDFVFANEHIVGTYDGASNLGFSPDGKRPFYSGQRNFGVGQLKVFLGSSLFGVGLV